MAQKTKIVNLEDCIQRMYGVLYSMNELSISFGKNFLDKNDENYIELKRLNKLYQSMDTFLRDNSSDDLYLLFNNCRTSIMMANNDFYKSLRNGFLNDAKIKLNEINQKYVKY
jgi:hypothetical protein